jgi:pyocin large subunit-like protein
VPKAFVASLVGNAVAKPLAYLGTYWRHDTMADNVNAIVARNAAMNAGRAISTGYAMVQAFASATTDNVAFGAVGYDPVQNRPLGAEERIQRFAGGTAAFAATFIPVARAGAAVPVGQAGIVSNRSGLWAAESWGRPGALAKHFRDHGADFGSTSAEHYAQQASHFLQECQARGLPTKVDSTGIIRVYDPATNTFGSYNPSGTTRTFYKPNPFEHGLPTNLDYWNAQRGVSPWAP